MSETIAGAKEELHRKLRLSRAGLLSKMDGLSEYDLRRPMTPTGTNLLGLVKHLADLRACAHADATIAELDLDAPGSVAHWPEEHRRTTLAVLLIRMVGETAQHAGHADIIRELIDGRAGPDHDDVGDDATWQAYVARIQAAADTFRS